MGKYGGTARDEVKCRVWKRRVDVAGDVLDDLLRVQLDGRLVERGVELVEDLQSQCAAEQ